jgi:hypothetical protein
MVGGCRSPWGARHAPLKLKRALAKRGARRPARDLGLLNGVSFEGPYAVLVAAIRQGLQEADFVEGRNLD